jgi:hypothetical protein
MVPTDVLSTHNLLKTEQNRSKLRLTRCYNSRGCGVMYITLILLTLILITWTALEWPDLPDHWGFQSIECVITMGILLEVTGRMYLHGFRSYWKTFSNVLDFAMFALSVAALVISAHMMTGSQFEGIFGEFVLVFRNIMMYLRLLILLKNQRRTQNVLLAMIDFSKLAEGKSNK